jgi:hypothetical protein
MLLSGPAAAQIRPEPPEEFGSREAEEIERAAHRPPPASCVANGQPACIVDFAEEIARERAERWGSVDPLLAAIRARVALGQLTQASELADEASRKSTQWGSRARQELAQALGLSGRVDAARALAARHPAERFALLAYAHAGMGLRDPASADLRRDLMVAFPGLSAVPNPTSVVGSCLLWTAGALGRIEPGRFGASNGSNAAIDQADATIAVAIGRGETGSGDAVRPLMNRSDDRGAEARQGFETGRIMGQQAGARQERPSGGRTRVPAPDAAERIMGDQEIARFPRFWLNLAGSYDQVGRPDDRDRTLREAFRLADRVNRYDPQARNEMIAEAIDLGGGTAAAAAIPLRYWSEANIRKRLASTSVSGSEVRQLLAVLPQAPDVGSRAATLFSLIQQGLDAQDPDAARAAAQILWKVPMTMPRTEATSPQEQAGVTAALALVQLVDDRMIAKDRDGASALIAEARQAGVDTWLAEFRLLAPMHPGPAKRPTWGPGPYADHEAIWRAANSDPGAHALFADDARGTGRNPQERRLDRAVNMAKAAALHAKYRPLEQRRFISPWPADNPPISATPAYRDAIVEAVALDRPGAALPLAQQAGYPMWMLLELAAAAADVPDGLVAPFREKQLCSGVTLIEAP